MTVFKKYGLFTLAGAALLLTAAPVKAEDPVAPPVEGKAGMERAHPKFPEGGITKSMFMEKSKARAEKKFSKLDKNGDGKISREEMKAMKKFHHKKGEHGKKFRGGPNSEE